MGNILGGLLGAGLGSAGGNWLGSQFGDEWGDLGATLGGAAGGYFGGGKDINYGMLGGTVGSNYDNWESMLRENIPGFSQNQAIGSTGGFGYNSGVGNTDFSGFGTGSGMGGGSVKYGGTYGSTSQPTEISNIGSGFDSGSPVGQQFGYKPTSFMDSMVSRFQNPDTLKTALGLYGLYNQDRAAREAQKRFGEQMGAYTDAQRRLQEMLNDPSKIRDNPQYKAMLADSEEALRRQAASGGQRLSGNLLNDLQKNAMRVTDQMYNQEMNRLQGLGQLNAQYIPAMGQLDAIRRQKQLEAMMMLGKGIGFF